jgi:hypothetical protein
MKVRNFRKLGKVRLLDRLDKPQFPKPRISGGRRRFVSDYVHYNPATLGERSHRVPVRLLHGYLA